MRVLAKYVVIEPITEEISKTSGGLLLGEKHRDDLRYKRASVWRSGELVDTVAEGDKIMFDSGAGHILPYPLDKYRVIREADIVVVE